MAEARTVDLVIVGGGCAGLSLARHLAHERRPHHSVAVIEPRTRYENDRTWCFWAEKSLSEPLASWTAASWSAWRFSTTSGDVIDHAGKDWAYHCVPSDRFYRAAQSAIAASPAVTLHQGIVVADICEHDDGVEIETTAGRWRARHVVDTRPPAPQAHTILAQAFIGLEVETSAPTFETACAGLMEDMRCDADGFAFTYVLPLSSRRALIEATRFAPHGGAVRAALEDDVAAAVASRAVDARIIRREQGILPMGLAPTHPRRAAARIVTAGAAGGALRASSGYAFLRIQRWAQACAATFRRTGQAIPHPPEPYWRQRMDRLFLRVLAEEPQRSPEIFMRMAQAMPAPAFARFMSEKAHATDWLHVIAAMPKAPFLKTALGAGRPPRSADRFDSAQI